MFRGTDEYLKDHSQVIMGLHKLKILTTEFFKENVTSLASKGLYSRSQTINLKDYITLLLTYTLCKYNEY